MLVDPLNGLLIGPSVSAIWPVILVRPLDSTRSSIRARHSRVRRSASSPPEPRLLRSGHVNRFSGRDVLLEPVEDALAAEAVASRLAVVRRVAGEDGHARVGAVDGHDPVGVVEPEVAAHLDANVPAGRGEPRVAEDVHQLGPQGGDGDGVEGPAGGAVGVPVARHVGHDNVERVGGVGAVRAGVGEEWDDLRVAPERVRPAVAEDSGRTGPAAAAAGPVLPLSSATAGRTRSGATRRSSHSSPTPARTAPTPPTRSTLSCPTCRATGTPSAPPAGPSTPSPSPACGPS